MNVKAMKNKITQKKEGNVIIKMKEDDRQADTKRSDRTYNMKAKDYLKLFKKYDILIDAKTEKLQRLKALTEKTTKSFSDTGNVQTSFKNDTLEESIIKIIEMQKELDTEVKRMLEIQEDIEKMIENLKNNNYCELLYKRYIKKYAWERIAVELGYSLQWTHILHGRALQEIQKELDKKILKSS